MLPEKPDYMAAARKIMRHDIYSDGCKLAGMSIPDAMESRGKETFFDGVVYDPADPEGYAQQFKIKA
jgi:nitrate/nitrite transport system substrate-binding protein